ncbi:MAG: oligoribonuclease [Candidatus Altiarchaeales archaeon]|nr:oligoribonuclease [Candidatus Altiarchaeales archaeon]
MGSKLVWMDMEFTGLDPLENKVLEVATAVTDDQLNNVTAGPEIVVHQPDNVLDSMDEWNTKHHKESGLTEKSRKSSETIESAQKKTLNFLRKQTEKNQSPLCGNSVHMDRWFMKHHMPQVDRYLHYRIIDVSTIKELVERWHPQTLKYEKKNTHRARQDILESISELKYYRKKLGL